MESISFYILIFFAIPAHLVSGQSISCYDCDPQNFASDCADPVANAVRSVPCTPEPDVINGTSICLSAYLRVAGNANLTGIYRGCRTLSPSISDFCDWFREERQGFNTTVVSCVACNTTRCNTAAFDSDGSNGAQNIGAMGAVALILNVLFATLLSLRE